MDEFSLSVLAAEKTFYAGPCVSLIIPTDDGKYGVCAHHCNTIAAVTPGLLVFTLPDGEKRSAAVSEGIIKIENNEVILLVDSAERPDEIDVERAKRAADEAREQLLQQRGSVDSHLANSGLARALNRIKIANGDSLFR